jgi:hypothetical protein
MATHLESYLATFHLLLIATRVCDDRQNTNHHLKSCDITAIPTYALQVALSSQFTEENMLVPTTGISIWILDFNLATDTPHIS